MKKLIIGLGNPGTKYELTRHNIGFLLLDLIADKFNISLASQKFDSLYGSGSVFGSSFLLVKPLKYMNNSGFCVAKFLNYFKIDPQSMLVIHDDIDMLSGTIKIRKGGGSGGHNGIKSIFQETKQTDFFRLKVGVGKPNNETQTNITDWVLTSFSDQELHNIQSDIFEAALERLEQYIKISNKLDNNDQA